ncbi:hypothetical protein [Burkholderia sp. HI2500]|uniref:hypothetical protein n=1 Tax=Burkholderia sp. HI2500 TaxID=2015358 RepID=UPI00117E917F|nr:hypothetical protein [Burkholderia sp. HI2500]
MNHYRLRFFSTVGWVLPIIGACWIGTCHARAIDSTAQASTIPVAEQQGSGRASVRTLADIYEQLVVIDSHLLVLISLEQGRVGADRGVKSPAAGVAALPASIGQHPCDQVSDPLRKPECEAQLMRIQRLLQEIDRLAMPIY